jgi:hypothetical protein
MKKIKICDRTLNNGLHKFEPEAEASIIAPLKGSLQWCIPPETFTFSRNRTVCDAD